MRGQLAGEVREGEFNVMHISEIAAYSKTKNPRSMSFGACWWLRPASIR